MLYGVYYKHFPIFNYKINLPIELISKKITPKDLANEVIKNVILPKRKVYKRQTVKVLDNELEPEIDSEGDFSSLKLFLSKMFNMASTNKRIN